MLSVELEKLFELNNVYYPKSNRIRDRKVNAQQLTLAGRGHVAILYRIVYIRK